MGCSPDYRGFDPLPYFCLISIWGCFMKVLRYLKKSPGRHPASDLGSWDDFCELWMINKKPLAFKKERPSEAFCFCGWVTGRQRSLLGR